LIKLYFSVYQEICGVAGVNRISGRSKSASRVKIRGRIFTHSDWKDEDGLRVLKATLNHATLVDFPEGNAQQTILAAVTALYGFRSEMCSWSSIKLDKVIECGRKIYEKEANVMSGLVKTKDLHGKIISCDDGKKWECIIETDSTVGYFDEVTDRSRTVENAVDDFLNWKHKTAIVSIGMHMISLVREDNRVYAFDSHPRNYNVASVTKFTSIITIIPGLAKFFQFYCPTGDFKTSEEYAVTIQAATFVEIQSSDDSPDNLELQQPKRDQIDCLLCPECKLL